MFFEDLLHHLRELCLQCFEIGLIGDPDRADCAGGVIRAVQDIRHSGIGSELMKEVINDAKAKKVNTLTLEVRESNSVARELYKKFGFREVALRKFYYGDEHGILMEKQVM